MSEQEPPLSAAEEARLRAFHERAAGEATRLSTEVAKQRAKHADLRVQYGAEAVTNWYSDHQAHLQEAATGGESAAAGVDPRLAGEIPAEGAAVAAAGGDEAAAAVAAITLGSVPSPPMRSSPVPRSPAAQGLRIRAGFDPPPDVPRSPFSPLGSPFDEVVEVETEEEPTVDTLGAPVCGPRAGLGGIAHYQACVLCYRRFEAWGEVLADADACPDSPLLQLLAADFLQAQAGGAGPAGNERLAAAAALPLAHREAGYLEALRGSALADWSRAYSAWLSVVRAWPSDLFAAKRGQFVCLMAGHAAGMLEIAKAAAPGDGELGRYYYGLLAFGLEQSGGYAEAEAAAREGLAGEFDLGASLEEDCWLQHGLAHALYFQGRHAEALEFLRGRCGRWGREALHPFLYTHLWWHLALLQVEEDDADGALRTYDEQLWAADSADIEVQVNALGMLVRLHSRGVTGLDGRWSAVLDAMAGSPYLHAYPLHNLLRLAALSISLDRRVEAALLLEGLRASADEAHAAGRPQLKQVVLPIALSLSAALSPPGDDAVQSKAEAKAARLRLMDLRGAAAWSEVGGSEEQRGFLLELAAGPVRAGKPTTALGQAMMSL